MTTDSKKAMTLDRDALRQALYENMCAADNGDIPLEAWPDRMIEIIEAHLAPREVSDEDVERACIAFYGASSWRDVSSDALREDMRDALKSFATSLPAAWVPDGEVRLWDTQWMNIVNHDNSYRDWSKDDAVAHAVKMTEQAIARNVADGKLPPKKIAAAPQAGEME